MHCGLGYKALRKEKVLLLPFSGPTRENEKKKLLYGGNSFLWLELAAEKFNAFLWFLLGFGIFVLVIIDHTL